MQVADFALERWFARWEFAVRHVLCASDVEGWPMEELLMLADDEMRERWTTLRLGYTESLGHPLLRTEIASLYERTTPDDIITFSGAEEGIFLAMHARLTPGDHAVVMWPSYQSLAEVARGVGAEVTLVRLDPADWSLDPDDVRRAMRPNTRAIVVNFPHNPTGALLSRDRYEALVAIAEQHGATLFSDEVYRWLELDEEARLPAGVDASPHAVSLGVLSKSFALAGLRVGWIATRDAALRERVAHLKDYTTICGSAPSEILGIIALRARDRVRHRGRQGLSRRPWGLDGGGHDLGRRCRRRRGGGGGRRLGRRLDDTSRLGFDDAGRSRHERRGLDHIAGNRRLLGCRGHIRRPLSRHITSRSDGAVGD